MKLRKFKSFEVVRLEKGNWMYNLAYIDYDDVTVTWSKEGFASKEEAQAQGASMRVLANSLLKKKGVAI